MRARRRSAFTLFQLLVVAALCVMAATKWHHDPFSPLVPETSASRWIFRALGVTGSGHAVSTYVPPGDRANQGRARAIESDTWPGSSGWWAGRHECAACRIDIRLASGTPFDAHFESINLFEWPTVPCHCRTAGIRRPRCAGTRHHGWRWILAWDCRSSSRVAAAVFSSPNGPGRPVSDFC